ncbi:MAG: hypothetical protein ACRDKL_00460 [Solirubrobacteraceae bacterium]
MRSAAAPPTIESFDPASFREFRLLGRSLDGDGAVRLRYALDQLEFEESFILPLPAAGERTPGAATVDGLLDLLHWVAGVSYYKAAAPPVITFAGGAPGSATTAFLRALYSEGLGEFAVVNNLSALPSPQFQHPDGPPGASGSETGSRESASESNPVAPAPARLNRLLIPAGGGKDSAVAIEVGRASGLPLTLFSVGDAAPIAATAAVSGYERLIATRRIDPRLLQCNAAGALNGHVPITAIIACVALLTAALHGHDAVTLANERSASAGNLIWRGVEVNHQFSKSLRAERLLAAAVAEVAGAPAVLSLLRPASELSIARAFAGMRPYHAAFTSCNRVFRLDPARRTRSWCCDCDKCRFVYLILAPFMEPGELRAIFGADLLAEADQFEAFARLAAPGAEKPFECVGEAGECLAAIRLISERPAWRDHPVVRRLVSEALAPRPVSDADLAYHFALSPQHEVPDQLLGAVHAVLGA